MPCRPDIASLRGSCRAAHMLLLALFAVAILLFAPFPFSFVMPAAMPGNLDLRSAVTRHAGGQAIRSYQVPWIREGIKKSEDKKFRSHYLKCIGDKIKSKIKKALEAEGIDEEEHDDYEVETDVSIEYHQHTFPSQYPTIFGVEVKKHLPPGTRIRMDRWGTSHHPFYRIVAAYQQQQANRGRHLETIGWWNPRLPFWDKNCFHVKADRAVYWLSRGANPTDQACNILDIAGIIRRTGREPKLGEWEWRIPKESGPEAPEGWKYIHKHDITWNHNDRGHIRRNNKKSPKGTPWIEKYGFIKYKRIPLDEEVLEAPLDGNPALKSQRRPWSLK